MKKYLSALVIALSLGQLSAQTVVLDCQTSSSPINNSGSRGATDRRNYDIANCWTFGGIGYTDISAISGGWSAQSGQATNLSVTAFWAKSPWLKPGTGNITVKAKLTASNGTIRRVHVAYLPYDAVTGNSAREGTRVEFDVYNFTTFNSTVNNLSFAIPAAIANSNQPYKIMLSLAGTGGNSRIMIDDLVIPGTYFADPANSCFPQSQIQDADSDGVADADDAYPNDATRAYNNFYPSGNYGTLMFEDLWPAKGDYDFNDLVIDYQYNLITNASNKVVEMRANIVTRAIGASYRNGFAVQFNNLSPDKITGVTGAKYHDASWLNNAANGTENGQTFANVIIFDDAQKVLPSPGGSGSNTIPSNPRVAPDTTKITVSFVTTEAQAVGVNDIIINPYIIVNQERGKEVHLPNNVPSSKVNTNFFGQMQDDTKPGEGKYYKTVDNLPWALNVVKSIPYTHTTNDFVSAYLKFAEWAQSNGTLYTDWFEPNEGYRDTNKLFVP
ncbi:MAG: LruC domain-containing protein [Bacteroidia bacterium]|nr:LruC domain-containing protein [Bacteroidia bacterium]